MVMRRFVVPGSMVVLVGWLAVVPGCCPQVALVEWSSDAAALAGDWEWDVLVFTPLAFTCDVNGDPTQANILLEITAGGTKTADLILDGLARSIDVESLTDVATYVGRGRATKQGQSGVAAENDEVIVEIEIQVYLLDEQAFGPCPEHVTTLSYDFKGKFDDQGGVNGAASVKWTPAEAANRVSQAVSGQLGQLIPLVPVLTTWETVSMHRP